MIDAGLNKIAISFHSHVKKTNEELSHTFGNYEKTIEGIKNALETKIPVSFNITINSKNYLQLPDFARFVVEETVGISFVSFNFIDAVGKARNAPELVPKICEVELYLNKAMKILDENGILFHVERIPLCYLVGFEHNCSEAIKFVNDEFIRISRIDEGQRNPQKFKKGGQLTDYSKFNTCECCSLNLICPGLDNDYVRIHGFQELYPRVKDMHIIERDVKDYANYPLKLPKYKLDN
ncbi:MAG: hypothetical protein KAS30_04720 [Candidatus Diapherotrites archaeon]|nr:hypothetical protein [Candidatus Diapherotrites archaeon]